MGGSGDVGVCVVEEGVVVGVGVLVGMFSVPAKK